MPTVTFIPDEVSVEVAFGENLLRAAMMADVLLTAPCGGDGTCGKCRVIIDSGAVETRPSAKLTDEQVAQGHVLACVSRVTEDVVVSVPAESRPGTVPSLRGGRRAANTVLSAAAAAARLPRKKSTPAVLKRVLELAPPDLTDNASDLTRVRHAMRQTHRLTDVSVPLNALRELPSAARDGKWTVTATMAEPCEVSPWIAGFEPGDTTGRQYAAAVDVGTTTIEVALLDLLSGETVASASEYNAQVARGEDVISRVIAGSKPEGLDELHTLVTRTIGSLVTKCCEDASVSVGDVVSYIVAGNTVMTHLLFRVSPASIRTSPYVPAAQLFPWVSAEEVSLPGGPSTQVVAMPCSASWLGGDIVSGVIAAGMPWSDRLTLFIDIGTNGEVVLGNKDWMVACSCSAGPAFEGGGVAHGMRAATGAIEQVRIDPATLEPMILTIGGVKPLGICGSGLIDVVSELFLTGAIDRAGHFDAELDSSHLRSREGRSEYVLVSAAESGTTEDIVITETDIENLMRAKAAIYAGINVLAESLGVPLSSVDEVVVAGGFGRYLDLERIIVLGMVPEFSAEKFVFLGNSSLEGARLAATSREILKTSRKVAEMMTYLELSVNAGFMESYMSALFLPHTDLSLFPHTEKLLTDRRAAKVVG